MTSNRDIAIKYAGGATNGRSLHMFIDGQTIYSYGYHFPMATRVNNTLYLFNRSKYSNTTARHESHVSRELTQAGARLLEVHTEVIREYANYQKLSKKAIEAEIAWINGEQDRLENKREFARKPENKVRYYEQIEALEADIKLLNTI